MEVRGIQDGASAQADLRFTHSSGGHLESEFHLVRRDAESGAGSAAGNAKNDLGCFRLHVPGAHNISNATAAVAISLELEVPLEKIREGLAEFAGVDRRFQVKGTEHGVTVIDDYGHHPTEIRATLAAARNCSYKQIHVLVQPHRYTPTQALMDDFAGGFHHSETQHLLEFNLAWDRP